MYIDQGNIVRAMECFKESVEVNPFWNAAFWYFKGIEDVRNTGISCLSGSGRVGGGGFLKFSLFGGGGQVFFPRD